MNAHEKYIKILRRSIFTSCLMLVVLSASGSASAEEEQEEQKPGGEFLIPRISCPEPDGRAGWYLEAPEITVIHTEPEAETWYRLTDSSGGVTEGKLVLPERVPEEGTDFPEKIPEEGTDFPEEIPGEGMDFPEDIPGEKTDLSGVLTEGENREETGSSDSGISVRLPAELFREGRNVLEIRMLSPEDGRELFREEREILLDLFPPEEPVIEFPEYPDGNSSFFHTSVQIKIKSEDSVSGVEKIIVQQEGGKTSEISGREGAIEIRPGYCGRISAYAEDYSGRRSKMKISDTVLCEDEAPEIRIDAGEESGVWRRSGTEVEVYVEDRSGKYGFSSGLSSVTCYAGRDIAAERTWDNDGQCETADSFRFYVSQASVQGQPVTVTVHASDRAGNTAVLIKELFIDLKAPVLAANGVRDGETAGKSRKAVFSAEDENLLADCSLTVMRTGMDGAAEQTVTYPKEKWNGSELKKSIELDFREDGIYKCKISAKDASGRTVEKTVSFAIDKTNPVIRYIEQLDGSYIPFFRWNYGDEMIRDLTESTYRMYLNGKTYFPGKEVTEEGVYLLEIRAQDMAGNETAASAVFTIDNTKPVIYWGELRDGGVYTESALLTVWVEEAGERLRYLEINGERQKLDYESRIFQFEILAPGKYTVRAQAEDRAGNRAEESITFQIKEQKGILPAFFPEKGENGREEISEERKKPSYGLTALAVSAAGAAVCLATVKRRIRAGKNENGGKTEGDKV